MTEIKRRPRDEISCLNSFAPRSATKKQAIRKPASNATQYSAITLKPIHSPSTISIRKNASIGVTTRNAKPSPSYYEMDPAEQLRVMKEIRQAGLELVGIYHSHTSSPAYPSSTDVKQAYFPETLYPNYPGAVYLIVTLTDRKNPGARGFTIEDNAITEVPVTVHAGADS